MSAITPILTSIASDLVIQILVIVAALASLVGISILVAYGFKKLRSVGGDTRTYAEGRADGDYEYDESQE